MAPASPEPSRWKRVKENWDLPVLLSSEKVPSDACASGTCLYVSPWSPLCMTQVLFKLLCLCWESEGVDLCAVPERGKSQLPIALQLSWHSAPKSFKARCYGGSSSQCRAGEPNGELSPLTAQSWAGEHSLVWYPSHSWTTALRVWVLMRPHLAPPAHLNEPPPFTSFFFFYSSQFLFKI